MIDVGVYRSDELSNKDYHGDKDSISRSGLLVFDELPVKYWSTYLAPNPPPKKVSKEMKFGSAFHKFVLEGNTFDDEYALKPTFNTLPKTVLLKNVGRPAYDAYKADKAKVEFFNQQLEQTFIEDSAGKKIISQEDYNRCQQMLEQILGHADAKEFLRGENYVTEQSYVWRDPGSGLLIKSRPDILTTIHGEHFYADIKTCTDATPRDCSNAIADGGLHIQGAMVRDAVRFHEGREIAYVVFIFVETKYPYLVAPKVLTPADLDRGEKQYKTILLNMKSAFDNNYFPGYELQEIGLPGWYID